jgi:hypothetical protein
VGAGVVDVSTAEACGVEMDADRAVGTEPQPASTRKAETERAANTVFLMPV